MINVDYMVVNLIKNITMYYLFAEFICQCTLINDELLWDKKRKLKD